MLAVVEFWALVIRTPTGERVKQNVDKLISLWKQATEKRNSTAFGNFVKDDGATLTTQDQLLAICDVFFELDPIMSNRRIIALKGGILEGGGYSKLAHICEIWGPLYAIGYMCEIWPTVNTPNQSVLGNYQRLRIVLKRLQRTATPATPDAKKIRRPC